MELVKPPDAATGDVLDDWKAIAQIARIINALADLEIVLSKNRNKLTLTEANAKLELMLGGGGGLGPNYYNGASQSYPCYYELNGSLPLTSLPPGVVPVNPPV